MDERSEQRHERDADDRSYTEPREESYADPDYKYHLILEPDERVIVVGALDLMVADEVHEHLVRGLARAALASLRDASPNEGLVTVALAAPELKIVHAAVKLLFDDLTRAQETQRDVLRRVLDKLPDEHSIRAIRL
jgi:hypothetical protein